MANFYLDVSAVGDEYQAYSASMTWGALSSDKPLPMDGNGLAGPGHTAAVAIAEIQIGTLPSDTNALVIAGATITAKTAVSAKNQFAIGASIAACVTNIVALINTFGTGLNQCDAATGSGASAALLPLPYFVFARVKPGATDTVQIATRFAGTTLSHAVNSAMAISHTFGTAPTITQFSGGADGPFAYLVTNGTPFGKTAKNYGLMTPTKAGTKTDPGLVTDAIYVRTKRGGSNLSVTMTEAAGYYTWTLAPALTNRQFVFDDGTIWTGDDGELLLTTSSAAGITGGPATLNGVVATISFSSISGRKFRIYFASLTGPYGFSIRPVQNGVILFEGVTLEEAPGSINGVFVENTNVMAITIRFNDCKWITKSGRILAHFQNNASSKFQYVDCEFEYFGLTANVSGIVSANGVGGDQSAEFIGCKFYDRNGVYSVVNPITGATGHQTPQKIIFDGCSGIDAIASGWTKQINDYNRQLVWENYGPYRDWRIETGSWLAEWRYGQNQPTLTSELPNGTKWSAKVLLRSSMVWGLPQRPLKITGLYRAASAVKTVTVDFLAQQAFTKSQVGFVIAYTDENNVIQYESTLKSYGEFVAGTVANCASGSGAWVLNGQTGFTAYKCALTTAHQIKINTEFVVYVLACGTIESDQTLYFNGEVALT